MKRFTPADILFAALLAWSVAAVALVWRAGRPPIGRREGGDGAAIGIPISAAAADSAAEIGFSLGGLDPKPSVVIFTDFQCPYCRRFAAVIDSLLVLHPELRVVEVHFPIPQLHPEALASAKAIECARNEGRYEEMRHVLFSTPSFASPPQWHEVAKTAGVNDSVFASCLATGVDTDRIAAGMAAGRRIGVHGTPTEIIHDSLFSGAMPLIEVERHLGLGRK